MTLINKTLAAIPNQQTLYDFVEPLEEMGMEEIITRTGSLNEQLREQFEVYEQTLRVEEGEGEVMKYGDGELEKKGNCSTSNVEPPKVRRQVSYGGQQKNGPSSQSKPNPQINGPSLEGENVSSKQANNLARGKHQRASISSCSSSDSYASYGSGYASGSGNSTDHELKQRNRCPVEVGPVACGSGNQNSADCPLPVEPAKKEEEEPEEVAEARRESQLKRHLSELEQLTDELASRNILSSESPSTAIQSVRFQLEQTVQKKEAKKEDEDVSSPEQPTISSSGANSRSASATPTPASQTVAINSSSSNQNSKAIPNKCPSSSPEEKKMMMVSKEAKQQMKLEPQSNKAEPYYHNLFQWEQLVSKGVTRPLLINDLDFTDLRDEDDADLLACQANRRATGEPLTISIPRTQDSSLDSGTGSGGSPGKTTAQSAPMPPMPPPPISPWFNTLSGSRPQSQYMSSPSPSGFANELIALANQNNNNRTQSPSGQSTYSNSTYAGSSRNSVCLPQLPASFERDSMQYSTNNNNLASLRSASSMSSLLFGSGNKCNNKRKKTMKLFWKEVREDRSLLAKLTKKRTIWDEIKPVPIDTAKLEHLFESKAKDLLLSKSRNGLDGMSQRKIKITVLDAKRSNAINIGMTKLPPMRTIKSAILKMDSSIMNREGIEKILTTMMPTEEEKSRIIEAQLANPDTPLGTAEQFLLNLASISALEARLKLWAFQLDYAQIEKEVAEPLMDLKQAIEEIERSETFRIILGTLLSIGNFLNSTNVKGFQIDYLEKVPEVKDTVHKHSLLHHLCLFIQEKFEEKPEISESDLYSEFTAVNRASKVDYGEVAKNLKKMQQDCKASWDYLKIVAKHDGLANLMNNATTNHLSTSELSSSTISNNNNQNSKELANGNKPAGKLNNLSKLSMITTIIGGDNSTNSSTNNSKQQQQQQQQPGEGDKQLPVAATCPQSSAKQLKTKVSDFLTDCAERIMVLMVIHRRVMNRFQKLLVYLGCPSHQIKQSQPQQILKIINEFALEYRTKRERVKEMLLKRAQQQQRNCPLHHPMNRWQQQLLVSGSARAARWAGSQQLAGSENFYSQFNSTNNNRPCSTSSSCASGSTLTSNFVSSLNCAECLSLSVNSTRTSGGAGCPGNLQMGDKQQVNHQRPGSPSNCSQASNYSDYLYDQSCCNSRQQSITPVPFRRPHSMSVSMYDLQQQQMQQHQQQEQQNNLQNNLNEQQVADEQLRRILGAGRSFDGACNDLYQLSHWSSTMARVPARPLAKFRAASMDSGPAGAETEAEQQRRQSSYYRYLAACGNQMELGDELEQNSDDEILQSLVRTVTSGKPGNQQQQPSNKSARNKILSRISCDRKSLRRNQQGIEMAN